MGVSVERAQLLEAVLEAAPDALLAVDEDGRIVFANLQAEQVFGYSRSELVGSSVEQLVPHNARAVHPVMRRQYVAHPVARPMGMGVELAARRKDGSEFPAEISLAPVTTEDGTFVAAAVRDVTERLDARAEREELRELAEKEQRERRQQQAERLESLGQLAGGVAHDFNNLLGAILNFASFVESDLAALDVPEDETAVLRSDVAQIRRAAERGAELTRQLLAFGRRDLARAEAVDLDELVERVRSLLRRTMGEHIEVDVERSPVQPVVMVDPGQLEQVLVNLAVNARDAMPEGGRLLLRTEVLDAELSGLDLRDSVSGSLATGNPPGSVRLSVIDEGTGMTPDVIERAFEPFFTTKPAGAGTGLGLATVDGIVRAFGGTVELSSEPGSGTTVTVELPLAAVPAAGSEGSGGGPGASGTGTILVVEDEEALREVTTRVLERAGYHVLVAANGDEALELAADAVRIDLLLTDVVMPRMSGPEVARRLARQHPDLTVLYMSGHARDQLAPRGVLDPDVRLLSKPFTPEELRGAVAACLDTAVAESEKA